MLTVIDEFTRECLVIEVARTLRSEDVMDCLAELFVHRGIPDYICSDMARSSRPRPSGRGFSESGGKTLFIEPGSPWENGHNESFNCKLRDALLDGKIFCTLQEAQTVIEAWRIEMNRERGLSFV
jgi:transposase InsO family protein